MRFKRIFSFIVATSLLALILCSCGTETAENKNNTIYTSFYTIYDFTRTITEGTDTQVKCLVPAGVEPHEWEPSTNTIKELSRGGVFIYNGCSMEGWAEDIVSSCNGIKSLNLSDKIGIDAIVDDPHIWLDFDYAVREYSAIADFLSEIYPENKQKYMDNYENIKLKIEKLDTEYLNELGNVTQKDIIVSHGAYGYLCRKYGLNQIAIDGVLGESDPSLAKMTEIVNIAKEKKVKTIFYALGESDKNARALADEINADVVPLATFEFDEREKDFVSVMEENLELLKKALK